MKSLTPTQMQSARTRAENAAKRLLGERPERDDYRREYGSLFDVLDVFALVIFLAAFAVSSTHIIKLMDAQAASTYTVTAAGIQISAGLYTVVHQIGLLFLAEMSAILFLVMARLSSRRLELVIFGTMSGMAALFVFYANLASGLNLFIASLPPIFTLGIGFRLEQIIVEYLRRKSELDAKYQSAINIYEQAQIDISTHPEYIKQLRAQVWGELAKKNAELDPDMPVADKIAIVQAEIKRHDWSQEVKSSPRPLAVNGHHPQEVAVLMN